MTPDLPWKGLSIDGTGAPPPELDRTGAVALVPAGDRAWAAGAAVTLARSLARGGRRVYLCDLDLVSPRLHDMVGVGRRSGASDFAVYGASSGHVTIQLEDRLLFVSAGTPVVDQEAVYSSRRWESLFEAAVHARAVVLLFLPADLRGAHALLDRVGTLVALGHPGEMPDLGAARDSLRLGFQPLSAPLPVRASAVDPAAHGAEAPYDDESADEDEPTDVEELFPDIDVLAPDVMPEPDDETALDTSVPGVLADAPWAADAEVEPETELEPEPQPAIGDPEGEPPEDDGWNDLDWGSGDRDEGEPDADDGEPAVVLEEATHAADVEPDDEPDSVAGGDASLEPGWVPEPASEPAEAGVVEASPEPEWEPQPAAEPAPALGAMGKGSRGAEDEWDESEIRERWTGPEERGGRWVYWLVVLAVVVAVVFAAVRMGWIDLPGVTSRRADTGQEQSTAPAAAPAVEPGSDVGAPTGDPASEDRPSEAATGSADPEATETPVSTPGPGALSAAPVTAPVQEWSLRIGAYSSQAVARREAATLASRVPDHVIVVAPVEVQGRLWWRVISSLATDQASAEGLRTELAAALADAEPDRWLVRRASRAFLLDETGAEAEARDRATEWRGRGIDAYVMAVPRGDGSRTFRVYAGAYEDGAEASVLRGLLTEAGVPSPSLVERRGILPE